MANGKQTRRKSRAPRDQPPFQPGIQLTPAQEEGIVAVTLMAIGILTALGAFNLSRGNILDRWTDILGLLFGWGRLLAPFFFGGLGVWLLLDSLDKRPDIGGARPLGLALLFVILLTALHLTPEGGRGLAAASRGEGGGLIGYFISDLMVSGIGILGTVLMLLIAACIGLVLLFQISPKRLWELAGAGPRALQSSWTHSIGAMFRRAPRGLPELGRPSSPARALPERADKPRNGTRRAASVESGAPPSAPPAPALAHPALAARIVGGQAQAPVHREWRLPRVEDILEESLEQDISADEIRRKVRQIEETLNHFGVPAKVTEVSQGPTITQFGVEPGFIEQRGPDGTIRRTKVKVSRISALQHDLELALAAAPVRVEAPVPGKPIVGIEVPNEQISRVSLRGVMESEEFKTAHAKSQLAVALGQDVSGQAVVRDLGAMPHLLIAGATGSGKSVCINALIACLLLENTPDDVEFVMVDPKRVELSALNGIPHLRIPVVVEMDLAVAALQTAVTEMDNRFKMFARVGARNIEAYNQMVADKRQEKGLPDGKLPYLILIVDELADLMMVAPDEVEKAITRLAQMARATGIHLVLATQRPSVDVVTGLIKANFPSRISFAVTSQIDSRVVLDTPGAEKLLGKGDMLYMASDSSALARLQGCFVSDRELDHLVTFWKGFVETPETPVGGTDGEPPSDLPRAHVSPSPFAAPPGASQGDWAQSALWSDLKPAVKAKGDEDELLEQAVQVIQETDRASISLLQRKLRIGYSRAAKLMDLLEQKGYVGPDEGSPAKGREILNRGNPTKQGPVEATPATPPESKREFVENGDDFDDWTEEDWRDLDRD